VAAAPPLIIFAPPAFALFIGPPVLSFATIGPGWWSGGYITGGAAALGAGAMIGPFSRRGSGFVGASAGFHGRAPGRFPWGPSWGGHWHEARGRPGFGGWHGGGFGGWHGGGGGWHEARGGGGFGGGHGHGH
jgi:hypothetical protein